MSNWIPFIESVIKKDDDFFYSCLNGGELIHLNKSELCVIKDTEQDDIIAPFHFSILYKGKVFFFPSESNCFVRYDIHSNECCEGNIFNGEDEIYLPVIGRDYLEIVGCKTTKVYRYEMGNFTNIGKLTELENWQAIRNDAGCHVACLWNNEKSLVFVYDALKNKCAQLKVDTESITAAFYKNGLIYLACTGGILQILDLTTNTIVTERDMQTDVAIGRIYVNEGKIYCFFQNGNKICVIDTNHDYKISKLIIDIGVESHTAWSVLDSEYFLCLAESKDYSYATVYLFSIKTCVLKKCEIERLYQLYMMNKKKIIMESPQFGLTDYVNALME